MRWSQEAVSAASSPHSQCASCVAKDTLKPPSRALLFVKNVYLWADSDTTLLNEMQWLRLTKCPSRSGNLGKQCCVGTSQQPLICSLHRVSSQHDFVSPIFILLPPCAQDVHKNKYWDIIKLVIKTRIWRNRSTKLIDEKRRAWEYDSKQSPQHRIPCF